MIAPALALALALALAGCEAPDGSSDSNSAAPGEADASPDTPSQERVAMAETAWLAVGAQGEVFTTFIDPDGRYRDFVNGELRFTGAWEQNADRDLCFSPDTGDGDCWSHGGPGLDGVMRITNSAGRAIEIKRIAYTPPPEPETDETEEATTQGRAS
ncbi:MAG: hypothetical protein QNI87_06900 [Erythrobacter sp.]|uniref:hypothetical protein n=1 Tax=Erythrobacter sp. TaxID=1042 RepID=UPI00260EF818|nr:hypothetical protein [Erythrobacter sp.]MDJ0978246.1 hypothetical protein [Erythrobacter sp.]